MNPETIGSLLRRHRELKRMSVAELSRLTRIPSVSLQAIERDDFNALPGDVFVRGFLRTYGKTVGLDADEVLAQYAASKKPVTPAAAMPVASPVHAVSTNRGRRFGVAIGFVLLLILFTLAVSIVLRPRGRDIPSELSVREAADAAGPLLS